MTCTLWILTSSPMVAKARSSEVLHSDFSLSHSNIAINKKTGKCVAVKAFGKFSNALQKCAAANQIEILKRNTNKHIIQLIDAFENNGKIYLVTELAHHGDLWSFLNKHGKLSEWSAAWIARQILVALHYLHSSLHVVHAYLFIFNAIGT